MGISLSLLTQYFRNWQNSNDTIHLVDTELDEVFWTGKVCELKNVAGIERYAVGFASRHFYPKTNSFENGVFIYVRRVYVE